MTMYAIMLGKMSGKGKRYLSAVLMLVISLQLGISQERKEIRKQMKQVCKMHWSERKSPKVDWESSIYYAGVLAMFEASQKKKYFRALAGIGLENQWATDPDLGQAASHSIAQVYLDMHRFSGSNSMYFVYQLAIDSLPPQMDHISVSRSQELFFVTPSLAKLAGITSDDSYRKMCSRTWQAGKENLYDDAKRLWKTSDSPSPTFDAQSNAWAFAALVRLWHELPEDEPLKEELEVLGKEMAEVFRYYQQPIGLWPRDFANPTGQSKGDTMATSLLCYAYAAGVNQGLLDRELYESHILQAWQAIEESTDWTKVEAGIFLMAGAEVLRLLP